MKILALSPHPDDVEMGAGGFLLKAIDKGAEVHVVYCLQEKGNTVIENAKRFNYKFSWFKNTTVKTLRPEYNSDTVRHLDSILYANDYTHLLIPHHGDSHQDHKNVNMIAQASIRRYSGITLQYEVASYTNRNTSFKPNVFFGIDGHTEQKYDWVTSYEDVLDDTAETVLSLNRVRGIETDNTYAEAFELLKWSNFLI
jgi:LmbE family N-acetylglucosaminyl deacetylase